MWVKQVVHYYTRTRYSVCIVNMLGGLSPLEHAQPCQERARAVEVRGLWTLTIWPLGGWFPHWLPLFPVNNWDLIWEEISKSLVTPLLRMDRFLSVALKETSLFPYSFVIALCCSGFGCRCFFCFFYVIIFYVMIIWLFLWVQQMSQTHMHK